MSRVLGSVVLLLAFACACLAPPPPGGTGRSTYSGRSKTPVPPASLLPTDIANLFAWYKSDALVTNLAGTSPPANGDSIRAWGDSSGNGRHLSTNNPTASGPTWSNATSAAKSQGVFAFASGKQMRVGFSALANTTVLVAWRTETTGGTHAVCDSTNTGNRQMVYVNSGDLFAMYSGAAFLTGGAVAQHTWNVQACIFSGSGNDTIVTNGVQAVNGTAGGDLMDGFNVGSDWNGANNLSLLDNVGEIIIYSRNLDVTTEIVPLTSYLRGRWGTP